MLVRESDIDQLVLGYVAEKRYFQTRNQLFEESPHLPEKVPILTIFGDISSENRLHTILEEYVQLKQKQLNSVCAACNNCGSLPDMWKTFDTIVNKIRNYCPKAATRPAATENEAQGIRRFSPMQLWQEKTIPANASMLERKRLNPVSNEFETVTVDNRKPSGSAKRKNTLLPKRNRHAPDEDLSELLHTSDHNDALALVGVKILSSMKKCVGKGSSVPSTNENQPPVVHNEEGLMQSTKAPLGPALDVEDLISDETREGLVEMTIDSLMNPAAVATDFSTANNASNMSEDFSELRKLLDLDTSNSSCALDKPVMQDHSDERELIEIMKGDDNIPEKPSTPDVPSSSLQVYDQDEKSAIAGLLAIQNSVIPPPLPSSSSNSNDGQHVDLELPTIRNIRSELSENLNEVAQETQSSNASTSGLRNIDPDDLMDACANMPPKKRFLVKETMTPEKATAHSSNSEIQTRSIEPGDHATETIPELIPVAQPFTHSIISQAASIANVEKNSGASESVVESAKSSVAPCDESGFIAGANDNEIHTQSSTRYILDNLGSSEAGEIRRSKRQHKGTIALRNLIPRPKPKSTKKSSKLSSLASKTKPSHNASSEKRLKIKEKGGKTLSAPKVKIMQPGQGPMVINLKDHGRMPLAIPGIVVCPQDQKISKDAIIQELVSQMRGANSTPLMARICCPDKNISTSKRGKIQSDSSKGVGEEPVLSGDGDPKGANEEISVQGDSSMPNVETVSSTNNFTIQQEPIMSDHLQSQIVANEQTPCVVDTLVNAQGSVVDAEPNENNAANADLLDSHALPTASETGSVDPRTVDNSNVAVCDIQPTPTPPPIVPKLSDVQHDLIWDDMPPLLSVQESPLLHDNDSTRDRILAYERKCPSSSAVMDGILRENYEIIENSSLFSLPSTGILITPQKTTKHKLYSTISPPSGIFSVLDQDSSDCPQNVEAQLRSVRSNLLSSFLSEEVGLQHFTEKNTVPTQIIQSQTDMVQRPLTLLGQNDIGRESSSSWTLKAANVTRSTKSSGKRTLVKKRGGSGILMCNQIKNMVRIEPKRHGVPAVRRCLVQSATGAAESKEKSNPMSKTTRSGKVFGKETAACETSNTSETVPTPPVTPSVTVNPSSALSESTPTSEKAVNVSKKGMQENTLKRKKRIKSHESRKKPRTSLTDCNPLMNWSYEDIQAKLDAIHGKRDKVPSKPAESDKNRLNNSNNTQSIDTNEPRGSIQRKISSPPPLISTASLETVQISKLTETTPPATTTKEIEYSELSGGRNNPTEPSGSKSDLSEPNGGTDNPTEPTGDENSPSEPSGAQNNSAELKDNPSLQCAEMRSDTAAVEPVVSNCTPVVQIEPLDLSLPSWACSKSPSPEVFSVSVPSETTENNQKSSDQAPTVESSQTAEFSNQDAVEVGEKHKKNRGRLKKKSSRFKKLESKIKKVNLKNMDIAKFLDSVEYQKAA